MKVGRGGASLLAALSLLACAPPAPPPAAATPAPTPPPPPPPPFPSVERLGAAAFSCSGKTVELAAEETRRAFGRAVVLPDNLFDGWSYAPWCSGTLEVDGAAVGVSLYFGGRGQMVIDGREHRFSFDAKAMP